MCMSSHYTTLVQHVETGRSWSMVGTDAEDLTSPREPTMMLNLRGYPPELQQSLVIHQFGHALGLEHEHQRSDFWDVVEPYLDINKMEMDLRVNPSQSEEGKAAFGRDWLRKVDESGEQSVNTLSEYDSESIMHYQ